MPVLRDPVGRQPGDVLAVENDRARRRPQHAGQAIEERALAGAVGADDGADLARGHGEVDVVERGQPAEADGQASVRSSGGRATAGRSARASRPDRGIGSTDTLRLLERTCRPAGTSGLLLRDRRPDLVLAALDLEDELADEGLVVLLAEESCRPAGSRRLPSSPALRGPR